MRLNSAHHILKFALGLAVLSSSVPEAHAVDGRVLPKGRSRFSLTMGISDGIQDVFNNRGERESAVKDYNLALSANNFKAALPAIEGLIDYLNDSGYHYDASKRYTSSYGIVTDPNQPLLGDALERGFLNVGGAGQLKQYNLMYQYGVTDKLSVGIAVPFVRQNIDLVAGIGGRNTANDIYYGFVTKNPGAMADLVTTLNFIRNADLDTLQDLLASRGYDRVVSQSKSGIGDIVVGGRLKYLDSPFRSGDWLGSTQVFVSVPTGRRFSPRDVLAQDFGTGAWNATAAHVVNYRPRPWLMFNQSINLSHYFPSTSTKRIRSNPTDLLPGPETEEDLEASLGDKFWLTLGTNFSVSSYLSLDLNYEWYWRAKSRYKGSHADRDYAYLSNETDLYLETFSAGITLSSIKAFLDYKFPLPGDLSLSYAVPVTGRNAVIAPFGILELALYF